MECKYCKNTINEGSTKCDKCGTWLNHNRFLNVSSMTLSLLIALVSVTSLTYKSAYQFYLDNIKQKEVSLELSILGGGTTSLSMIAKNLGTADAYLQTVRVHISAKYQNSAGEEKIRNSIIFRYSPTSYNDSSMRKNISSAIIPAGEYRLLNFSRKNEKPEGWVSDNYENEKVHTEIKIKPVVINLETTKVTKNVNPNFFRKDDIEASLGVVFHLMVECVYPDTSNPLCEKFAAKAS